METVETAVRLQRYIPTCTHKCWIFCYHPKYQAQGSMKHDRWQSPGLPALSVAR